MTDLLPTITVPTLVLHPERDIIAPVEWGRFLADHIPSASSSPSTLTSTLICVSDVIDDMARHIGEFLERTLHSSAPIRRAGTEDAPRTDNVCG